MRSKIFLLAAAGLAAAPAFVANTLAGEILYAPFTQAGGAATAGLYSGDVWVTVSGLGQALADDYSDAFYVRNGATPEQDGFWDLAIGTSAINGSGSQEASKMIVGPTPAYNPTGIYTFEVNAGAIPTKLHFGVDDDVLTDNSGAYTIVVGAAPTEVVYAPFTQAGGVETTGTYEGKVAVIVSGVGQSFANAYNDAFYLLPGADGAVSSPTHEGFYDLAFGASPIVGSVSDDAANAIVGVLPGYNSANVYTAILDTGASTPTHLHFGVDDDILSDNSGAYTIAVRQLGAIDPPAVVPEPATWAMTMLGFAGLALAGSRSSRKMRPVRRRPA
jgi:hypothetical protein